MRCLRHAWVTQVMPTRQPTMAPHYPASAQNRHGCRGCERSDKTRLSDVMVSLQSSTAPGARWGHEHLRGEYVEVRAIAVDRPRAIPGPQCGAGRPGAAALYSGLKPLPEPVAGLRASRDDRSRRSAAAVGQHSLVERGAEGALPPRPTERGLQGAGAGDELPSKLCRAQAHGPPRLKEETVSCAVTNRSKSKGSASDR